MAEVFDVFLSHNSRDKTAVRDLAEELRERGLRVWFDEWQLVPGRRWQDALEEVIGSVRSAAVLIGGDGLGPWEAPEMRACLSQCVERGIPVIPVLLPSAPQEPELPLFLKQFTWVDFRGGWTEESLGRLVWGITGKSSRIFLSYKRDVDPDEKTALGILAGLEEDYHVFIDQNMVVGTRWAEHIKRELERCDCFVVLLSARSVYSEAVQGEVEMAAELAEKQGRPEILTVRLDYEECFPAKLGTHLDELNWVSWQSSDDIAGLVAELTRAIREKKKRPFDPVPPPGPPVEFPQPLPAARLERPDGTMDPGSKFYIEREKADQPALEAIAGQGVTIVIKAARQMGKSSLLGRIAAAAKTTGSGSSGSISSCSRRGAWPTPTASTASSAFGSTMSSGSRPRSTSCGASTSPTP